MNTKDSVQSFFRVYVPNETSDDMELPLVSNEISGTALPRKVTVKNVSSGNVWKMEMTRNGESGSGTVLLRDGWKKIVKDKNEPIFLVFEFDGSRLFHFSVYEHSSMCKITRSPLEKEVIEVESENSDEEQDDVIEEDLVSTKRKEIDGTSRRRPYVKADHGKYIKYLDDKLNPCFPVDVTQNRMRIPALLINDYDLQFPNSVIVSDKINEMKRKITVWRNKSVFINGLGSIMRRNYVKPSDLVVCELKKVDGHGGIVREIKVHIIKA